MFHVPEQYRVTSGALRSDASDGNNGGFKIPAGANHREMSCIASDGLGWEHISVKAWDGRKTRIPTWHEMCYIKLLFWDAEDTVMQLHPPQSQWVSMHPDVLHLWRPTAGEIPTPHALMVGLQGVSVRGTGR